MPFHRSNPRAVLLMVAFTALALGALLPAAAAQPPAASPPPSAPKAAASRDLLDINAASPAQLNALPGMGPVYTQRVIAGRPYTAKSQLSTRGILPNGEYAGIRDLIIAHRIKK